MTPNSGQDQEWRQESGYSYSGIAAGSPAGGVVIPLFDAIYRQMI